MTVSILTVATPTATAAEVPGCPVVATPTTSLRPSPSVTLSWAAPAGVTADSFLIYRAESGGMTRFITSVPGDATQYRDSDLSPGRSYSYIVTTYANGAESAACSAVGVRAVPLYAGLAVVAAALVLVLATYEYRRHRAT